MSPLDGVVEADWASATFTMNWEMTRPDAWIAFEPGEPTCMVYPAPRGSVKAFSPNIKPLAGSLELDRAHSVWRGSRDRFIAEPRAGTATSRWQKHYFRGASAAGAPVPGHQTKLEVRDFRDLR